MVKKSPRTPPLSTQHESALIEIRRQLDQAYALVSAARSLLQSVKDPDAVPCDLLDIAEDLLADREWMNRMDELRPGVRHG
jgi:hypothetical protein